MAGNRTNSDGRAISVECACGERLKIVPDLLGRVLSCPHCGRRLRVALRFLLMAGEMAPNITIQCTCGRFIIESTNKAGKRVTCGVCGQRFVLPKPVLREGHGKVVRVPQATLRRQLRTVQREPQVELGEPERLERAVWAGNVSLKPGESVCVNPHCGALLPGGANVCARCGTNVRTGRSCKAPGPRADPRGRWVDLT